MEDKRSQTQPGRSRQFISSCESWSLLNYSKSSGILSLYGSSSLARCDGLLNFKRPYRIEMTWCLEGGKFGLEESSSAECQGIVFNYLVKGGERIARITAGEIEPLDTSPTELKAGGHHDYVANSDNIESANDARLLLENGASCSYALEALYSGHSHLEFSAIAGDGREQYRHLIGVTYISVSNFDAVGTPRLATAVEQENLKRRLNLGRYFERSSRLIIFDRQNGFGFVVASIVGLKSSP